MIWREIEKLPRDFGPSAVTIGNFDGVHAGHRKIMLRLVAVAREHGWTSCVLTFEPHPMVLVAPARAPKLITTLDQRCALMEDLGVEQILILPFTQEIARLTPEEFVQQTLVDRLHARAVLVGENFRFGHRAAGNTSVLAQLGEKYGYITEVIPAVEARHCTVSSTEVRRRLESGDVSAVNRLLCRPYSLEGHVVRGHGVGSRQTVPTLNLATSAELLPARGVYITRTYDLNSPREWPSISNIGYRPTFGGGEDQLSIETFLLAQLDGGGPEEIRVEFLRRVREERKFESPEALKQQILRDVGRAQTYFRRVKTH
ncbi:MAG TPA: bifunctional riboflavin kinase/FAD synthetase [Bryobacteraceae bacterium]|nr:bifunctional riboflavin kinase/FAD synthetase [Bryobacteraceae bacterium]